MSDINIGVWSASRNTVAELIKHYLQTMVDQRLLTSREDAKRHIANLCDMALNAGDMTVAEHAQIIEFCESHSGLHFLPNGVKLSQKVNQFATDLVFDVAESMGATEVNALEGLGINTDLFKKYNEAKAAFESAQQQLLDTLRSAVVQRITQFFDRYGKYMNQNYVAEFSHLQ